ncbi:MAG: cob(I)yrinic acid a,c-diamide adenosyltransferase [Desulfobacterota bacterium]|nr:cob(I)yrinic acid a,c-diamide adenosyltransferase [Thermodesulfobacteriota bacterium]
MDGKPRILIFTGEGKGKTTAALGIVLRASGHGFRILVIQFIKSNPSVGELKALRDLPGVEVLQMGSGFTPPADDPAFVEHRKAAENALGVVLKALQSKRYDLIVLDEICTAIAKGLVEEDRVIELLRVGDEKVCLVLTGRGATPGLIEEADTVTEMLCLKHGLREGWRAQRGIEY